MTLLNYTITSNHIHLLVQAPEQDDDRQVIARSMQLVAGRVGQEYNRHPHHRFRVIDEKVLLTLARVRNMTELDEMRTHLAREKIQAGQNIREAQWSEAIGGGDRDYVEGLQSRLTRRLNTQDVMPVDHGSGMYQLKEGSMSYQSKYQKKEGKNGLLRLENGLFWR